MIISQPALICLEAIWRRLLGRDVEPVPPPLPRPPLAPPPNAVTNRVEPGNVKAVARAPADPAAALSSLSAPADGDAPLTAAERRARAAALRALAFSRQRQFTAAQTAFTAAARLDPLLDLTRTPGFWKLERGAHEAAIEAYLAAGRDRDAAVLRARVRSMFRPKPVRPRPEPAFHP